MLPMNAVAPLALFMASLLALSLLGLAASGHFPSERRAPAFTSGSGPIVLFGSIAVSIAGLLMAFVGAWRLIPWYAAVIGGGLTILVAPLLLQRFSERFVDGRGALLIFSLSGALCALLLIELS